jgi:hypothetical protein
MINIKDVEERLKRNPEPQEVKDMRKKILDAFNNLEFIEEGHQYYIHNADGTVDNPISVSGLIQEFEPFVDWDEKAAAVALKEDVDIEVIKRRWKENNIRATNSGSIDHLFGEMHMNFALGNTDFCEVIKPQYEDGFLVPSCPRQDAVVKYWEDIMKIDEIYPLLPEAKMYMPTNNKFGIKKLYCGTADITHAIKHKGEWCIMLHDYKGLPIDTPIATVEGWKTMHDIQMGDIVFDRDGNPTKVLHTSSIHFKPCLKITFDDDTNIICDEDHRWLISYPAVKGGIRECVMTAKEIRDYIGEGKYDDLRVYISKPTIMTDANLPIPPYVLGWWISKGGFNSIYPSLFDLYSEELKLKESIIPDIYLFSSIEQRYQLLRGMMDENGCYDSKENLYILRLCDMNVAVNVARLLDSLGMKNKIIYKDSAYIHFTADICPFSYSSMITNNDMPKMTENSYYRRIVKVEEVETVPTRCIEVDSPTHTFCCGYNMLVTHNTNKCLTKSFARDKGVMMLPPFDDIYDEPQGHYTFQLSAYALMLMNLGFKVIDRKLIWLKPDGTYEKIPLPDITDRIVKCYQ